MPTFDQFRLPPALLSSLKSMNFQKPTPIQEKAIPVALTGRDLLGMAQTGTGKTAAFLIPVITRLMTQEGKRALILAPTRELALQINIVLRQLLGKNSDMRSVLLIGGLPLRAQVRDLNNKPRIIVATPGRLVDHLNHTPKLLHSLAILVVDEADRMLDMGFHPQLKVIQRFIPKKRQTMMFSATFPENIKKLANEFLYQPQQVTVGETHKPIQKIEQSIIETTAKQKNDVLLDELNARQGSVLIFTRTKHRTARLMRYLQDYGYKVTFLHGNRTQAQRKSAIEGFRRGDFRILVATDIASRGLDIDDIAHVINYDLPQQAEDYVHRIGRTARNGKSGQALNLLTPEDRGQWKQIHRAIQSRSV